MIHHYDHMILVDGSHTYLLAHWITDSGICLMVSGPETILLHEHTVTECDGSELNLGHDAKTIRSPLRHSLPSSTTPSIKYQCPQCKRIAFQIVATTCYCIHCTGKGQTVHMPQSINGSKAKLRKKKLPTRVRMKRIT